MWIWINFYCSAGYLMQRSCFSMSILSFSRFRSRSQHGAWATLAPLAPTPFAEMPRWRFSTDSLAMSSAAQLGDRAEALLNLDKPKKT
jgi:hypothetical protein